jgi:uncharacterized coiled-coil DUF342 family protein
MTELEMTRLANEGHVKMIADLAAQRDALFNDATEARNAVFALREELMTSRSELYAMKRERDAMRGQRDKLLYDA